MTKSEIRASIKTRLDEDSVYRPDAEINEAIDEGMKSLCIISACFSRFANISVKSGASIYSLPYDYFLMLRVSIADDYPTAGQNSKRIFPETIADLSRLNKDWIDDSDTPGSYILISGLGDTGTCIEGRIGSAQIWLYPRPNAIKILQVEYIYFPATLDDDDSPPLPTAYHELIEDYGTYISLMKETDVNLLKKALVIWDDFLKDALALRKRMMLQYEGSDFSFLPYEWQKQKLETLVA